MAGRRTADERREDVLNAAVVEFAAGGLDGTSTDAIARRAGISQPYLFRLFPTKKALFLAAVERTFERVMLEFRDVAQGLYGLEAKEAMGNRYLEMLGDKTFLRIQLHAYAAAVDDDEVREVTARGFMRLWDEAVVLTGMDPEMSREFMAHGMLLNIAAAIGLDASCPEDLTKRLLGVEGAAALPGLVRSAAQPGP